MNTKMKLNIDYNQFVINPSATNYLLLNNSLLKYQEEYHDELEKAASWHAPENYDKSFSRIRAVIDRYEPLTADDIMTISDALGYALAVHIGGGNGERVSEADIICNNLDEGSIILEWDYDSSKGYRSDPDYGKCFLDAATFIEEGSTLRTTNKSGPNTAGTRLVEGLGEKLDIYFLIQ